MSGPGSSVRPETAAQPGADVPGVKVRVARTVTIGDPVLLARCRRAPELGPRILFFSGGTALRGLSVRLPEYTHNSIHLITPFDSGGSSAVLRQAFGMPAVGDLRNRLMALADHSSLGRPEVYELFAFRFPSDRGQRELDGWLTSMIAGRDPRMAVIPQPLQALIRNHLGFFHARMPADFDLRGANIGNLILTGGYLNHDRDLDPVVFLFSKLVEVRGVVRPIASVDAHLVADLANGRTVIGQHRLTGKTEPPLEAPVQRLRLSRSLEADEPVDVAIEPDVEALIRSADLICYPMGSFYSSVVANLLAGGVGAAVAATDVPKVFVPNTGHDPEQAGLGPADQVEILLRTLRDDCGETVGVDRLLNFVLVDAPRTGYNRRDLEALAAIGVEVVDTPLAARDGDWRLDDERVAQALVSLT